MIWFFLCVGLLIAGYFIYGKFIERIFGPKPELKTPAITMAGRDRTLLMKFEQADRL